MKRSLCLLILTPLLLSGQEADTERGLVAQYFEIAGIQRLPDKLPKKKPYLVRIEKKINYPSTGGDFYGARIRDFFYVRWTGLLRAPKKGTYDFWLNSDDGSELFIDGKKVIANRGLHGMREIHAKIKLSVGDHEIMVHLFEAGGGVGVILSWQPPDGKRKVIPSSAFYHKKGSEKKIDWDKKAWKKRPKVPKARPGAGAYAKMDHGPFYSGTINSTFLEGKNFTNKGLVFKLEGGAMLFDTELLRMSAGWTGGYVGIPGNRDGIEGQPFALGEVRFGTKQESLGWANFKDTRKAPWGPLPRKWGRYTGLYLHENNVILSYTVAGRKILEMPGLEDDVFSRTMSVDRGRSSLRMLVCEDTRKTGRIEKGVAILEDKDGVTVVGLVQAPKGCALKIADSNRIELEIPKGECRFQIRIWSGKKTDLSKVQGTHSPLDLKTLIKGGPARWTQKVVTQGRLGTGKGPYVVDTLTIPFENPWKSYMRISGMDFFKDGRAAVCTMDGDVWIISGIDAELKELKWKRYATGLFQSLGLKILNGKIYTLGRDQITRFHDFNGDGEADFYENFNNDCQVSPDYHEFALNLHADKAGNFYYAKGMGMGSPHKTEHHGCLMKVSKDGKKLEVYATGLRAPNGMGMGPNDELTVSDNQGNWMPASRVSLVEKGGFYGQMATAHRNPKPKTYDRPICWIPMDTDNSSGGQVWVTSDKWGAQKGEMLHLSYGKCKLMRVYMERDVKPVQGGVFTFPLRFSSGTMRARFNPVDGQLYVCGMKGWQTSAARTGCVERVRYTGKPLHMPAKIRVTATGLKITFSDPLDPETAGDADLYSAVGFNLRYTSAYGSKHYRLSDPKKLGEDILEIKSVKLSKDRKTVTLKIPKIQPMHCLVLRYRIRAADGTKMSQKINYTIHKVPGK